jgi:hypothetical protein
VQWWYNVTSGQVERDDERGPGGDLMGPYDTQEAAEQALQTARDRTEQWDAQDREWEQRGSGDWPQR